MQTDLNFTSDDPILNEGFQWAKAQALAYVFHHEPLGDWYEAALPGRPLVEIGKTDTLWADFFVGQQQLAKFKLGQALRLRLDTGGEPLWIPAKLTWISTEAEFTPKGVQTREARNDLVFRARALAANPQGELKRGLPVEVWE